MKTERTLHLQGAGAAKTPTPVLSFAEFRATAEVDVDLMEALPETVLSPARGITYMGQLYIEYVTSDFCLEDRQLGAYCLTIGNQSHLTDDIMTLESRLYNFAVDEGFCARPAQSRTDDAREQRDLFRKEMIKIRIAAQMGDELSNAQGKILLKEIDRLRAIAKELGRL